MRTYNLLLLEHFTSGDYLHALLLITIRVDHFVAEQNNQVFNKWSNFLEYTEAADYHVKPRSGLHNSDSKTQ